MSDSLHPREALFQGAAAPPALAPCVHYAGSEKLILKALKLQRDMSGRFDVTCDCEDGAPRGGEEEHARMIAALLRSEDNQYRRAGVRIHDPESPHWQAEAELFIKEVGSLLPYLVIPKGRSAAQVASVAAYIADCCKKHGLTKTVPLHVLIETPQAVEEAHEIAAIPEVETLDFGLLDFISEQGGALSASAMKSPAQFEHKLLVRAKSALVAAALRYGKVPAHNITVQLKDPEQTFADARRARDEFGFLRMWSIHPAQIQPILDAFTPAPDEVEQAATILHAAQEIRWAPLAHNGELHDRASYRYFWLLLERAHAAGAALDEPTRERFFAS